MDYKKAVNWSLFILLAMVWGSSFVLMKHAAESLSGWQIGAIRILSAGAVCLPFGILNIKKIPKEKLLFVIVTGLIGNLFPAFLFGIAIQRKIEGSLAGILNSLTPLFVIVIGLLFFKKGIQKKKATGVCIGFCGLLLLNFFRGPVTMSNTGFTLLILLATVFYGFNVNIISHYLKGINPIQLATVSLSFLILPAALVLFINPLPFAEATNLWPRIMAAIVLGLLGSAAATILFYVLIKRAGGLFASLVTYAIPVVAIFWGLIEHENIGLLQIGCLGIILSGVYLANK